MNIVDSFFAQSKIDRNVDTESVMDFLCLPESINKMLVASDLGLPVLTPIVKELEKKVWEL